MDESIFGVQKIPGTYIRVLSEGLISPQGLSTGNIGIVGTAEKRTKKDGEPSDLVVPDMIGKVSLLSSMEDARAVFAESDSASTGTSNLMRSLDLLFANGARTVYAYALAKASTKDQFTAAVNVLLNEDVNILVAPEWGTADQLTVLAPVKDASAKFNRDVISVIGCDDDVVANIAKNTYVSSDPRVIMCTPGVRAYDVTDKKDLTLNGRYTAAAVAGLLASLGPQTSPTNKALSSVTALGKKYSYSEIEQLLSAGLLTLEVRNGVRVVRGITTDSGAFLQITTRRIVDYAKAGIRQVSNPFVGKLNNERVRKALKGALDSFLTTMVVDEALVGYQLEVKASRDDEIAGRCVVNVAMQPTFSIDYIRVTLNLS